MLYIHRLKDLAARLEDGPDRAALVLAIQAIQYTRASDTRFVGRDAVDQVFTEERNYAAGIPVVDTLEEARGALRRK
jgi:hypothetical protein